MSKPAIEIKHDYPQPGTVLEYLPVRADRPERIRVLGAIGAGSMCTVLACEALDGQQEEGGAAPRKVAAKVLDPARCGRSAEERFEREAELLCRLSHPNLVRGLGSGTWRPEPQGPAVPLLVMELLEGRPLSKTIGEGSMGFAEALGIVAGLAGALGYMALDGRVIAHRDVKPSNVMLCGGRPVLIDLGVAKTGMVAHHDLSTRLVGTVRFMAPEQIADSARADARSDIYALGMMLLDMWGCRRVADGRDDVAQRFSGEPPRLSEADVRRLGITARKAAATDGLLAGMCAYEPHERFQSHEELVRAIGELLEGGGRPARSWRLAGASGSLPLRRRAVALGLTLGLGALLAAVALAGGMAAAPGTGPEGEGWLQTQSGGDADRLPSSPPVGTEITLEETGS